MSNNDFKLCPMCGSKDVKNLYNRKWTCNCWFELFNNVATATWIIIKDNSNNILFEVRAKAPKKWYLALPWWFIEPDENLENGVMRECREEIWLKIKDIKYLYSYPNTYIYNNIEYKTCDIFFLANIWDASTMNDFIKNIRFQKSEVSKIEYHKIETNDDIEKLPIAFESTKQALKYSLNHK